MKRYARKRDANHLAIAAELRARGFAVSDLSASGSGCPDLVVSRAGTMRLVEVKAPEALNKAGTIRKAGRYRAQVRARQIAWAALHEGLVLTVTSADEVESSWPIL